MAEEKREVELALQMNESGQPRGNEGHDSRSVNDYFRSLFSLSKKRTYRRVGDDEADGEQPRTTGGLKSMPFIIGTETCEKLAVVGVQANMVIYLTTKYNMKKAAATSMLNALSGTMGLSTLPRAFLADSYLDQFGMITIGCFSYVLGMFIQTPTTVIPGLLPSSCSATDKKLKKCEGASAGQFAVLRLFFTFMAGGSAETRPSVIAFGEDQFSEGEKIQALLSWIYPRSTRIFTATCFMISFTLYVVHFKLVLIILGLIMGFRPDLCIHGEESAEFKIRLGFMNTILLRLSLLDSPRRYPFNASAEPGYVYHCHILDREDNETMRPFKLFLEFTSMKQLFHINPE